MTTLPVRDLITDRPITHHIRIEAKTSRHVYVNFLSGEVPSSLGSNGQLCFRIEEWESFKQILRAGDPTGEVLLIDGRTEYTSEPEPSVQEDPE